MNELDAAHKKISDFEQRLAEAEERASGIEEKYWAVAIQHDKLLIDGRHKDTEIAQLRARCGELEEVFAPPSWDDAPAWAHWLAMDHIGVWRWNMTKPVCDPTMRHSGEWWNGTTTEAAKHLHCPWWHKTLQARPNNDIAAPQPAQEQKGCDYQGRHFGASYEDATCIDGYLWDLDSCDEPGGALSNGGDVPCPQCNGDEYKAYCNNE